MGDMNTKDFLIGTLIGGFVGVASALLLAPKTGKELRTDINEQAQLAREKTSQLTSTAYEKGNEWATYAKEKSSTIAKTVSDQSTQVVDKVKDVAATTKSNAEEIQEAAEGLAESGSASGEETAQTAKEEVDNIYNELSDQEEKRDS